MHRAAEEPFTPAFRVTPPPHSPFSLAYELKSKHTPATNANALLANKQVWFYRVPKPRPFRWTPGDGGKWGKEIYFLTLFDLCSKLHI